MASRNQTRPRYVVRPMRALPLASEGPEAVPCCFVCAHPSPPLLRACQCRDLAVHGPCLARVVAEVPAHGTACPVCRAPYADRVTFVERWRCAPRLRPWTDASIDVVAVLTGACIVTVLVEIPHWTWNVGPYVTLVTWAGLFVLCQARKRCTTACALGIRRGGCCLCLCGKTERDVVPHEAVAILV